MAPYKAEHLVTGEEAMKAKENAVEIYRVLRHIAVSWMREDIKIPPAIGMAAYNAVTKISKV